MKRLTPLIPVLVLLILRLPDIFLPYFNIDEVTNHLFANLIVDERMNLYDFLGNTYLATHYIYVLITALFGKNNIAAIHAFHLVWCLLTTLAIYYAGLSFTQKKKGGLWAAFLYVFSSLSFMSKDFRPALSESFSLLPLSLAALAYFSSFRKDETRWSFVAGLFAGIAGLFKVPAVIIIFPIWLTILLSEKRRLVHFIFSGLGVSIGLFLPLLFVDNFSTGMGYLFGNLGITKKYYVSTYEELPFLYWFFKYMARTLLIIISFPLSWYFAYKTVKNKLFSNKNWVYNHEVFFLVIWFVCAWMVVSIGKRIFYHYFIFSLPALCLLAAGSIDVFWDKLHAGWKKKIFLVLLILPAFGYTFEGIMGWSTQRKYFNDVVEYIRSKTVQTDRIYVWGMLPQIYFESGRDPATTFFWSDVLAGFSPGSPAMEYMISEKKPLQMVDSIIKDLHPSYYASIDPTILNKSNSLNRVKDSELFSQKELLDNIENPFWKKVMEDFTKSPPELFLDTSPTGIRGFGNYPAGNYEVFRRYLLLNYVYATTLNDIVIYRYKWKSL